MLRAITVIMTLLTFEASSFAAGPSTPYRGYKVASAGIYDFGPPMSDSVRSRELTIFSNGEVVEVDQYIHYPNGVIAGYEVTCVAAKIDSRNLATLKSQIDTIQPDDEIEKEQAGADGGAEIFSRYFYDNVKEEMKQQPVARTRFNGKGLLLLVQSKDAALAIQKVLQPILAATEHCKKLK